MYPKLTLISSLFFFFDSILDTGIKLLHNNSILPASLPRHTSNWTSEFSRKQEKYLSGQTSTTLNTKHHCVTTCQMHNLSKEAIHREHPSHRQYLNTHAFESYATNKRGLHTLTPLLLFLTLEHLPSQIQQSSEWQHEINQIETKGVEKV